MSVVTSDLFLYSGLLTLAKQLSQVVVFVAVPSIIHVCVESESFPFHERIVGLDGFHPTELDNDGMTNPMNIWLVDVSNDVQK